MAGLFSISFPGKHHIRMKGIVRYRIRWKFSWATRLFFSRMQGVPWEFTNAELEKVLAAAGPGTDSAGIMAVLDRCSDVAFARGTPDASEFAAMIEKIRGRVSSGSNIRAGTEVPKVRPDTGQ